MAGVGAGSRYQRWQVSEGLSWWGISRIGEGIGRERDR